MMDHGLVTVILPLYRVWAFLPAAFDSLRAQTYRNWECLCLDDGSDNDRVARAKVFARDDPRFVVRACPHAGVVATRNRGLEEAKGDFVTFFDQDDLLHPRFLERMVQALEATGAGCAVCSFVAIGTESPFEPGRVFPAGGDPTVACVESPLVWALEERRDVLNVWQKLWRREALGDLRFEPRTDGADDALFSLLSLARLPRAAVLHEPLYAHREHRASVTTCNPSRYAFAKLRCLLRLAAEVPPPAMAAFRRHALWKLGGIVKDYGKMSYPAATHRAIGRGVGVVLRACGLCPLRWSLGKCLRYWRYRRRYRR